MVSTLLDRLPGIASVLRGCSSVTASELRELKRDTGFQDITVALQGDALFLIKWIILLDGSVRRMVLIPQATDQQLFHHITSVCSVDWLVCDGGTVANESTCNVYVDHDLFAPLPCFLDDTRGRSGCGGQQVVTQWVLVTSGTTRTPKLVAHTLGTLTRSMKVESRFSPFRWGLMYDAARFAGIQVLLQSLLSGATLLAPRIEQSLLHQLQWLAEEKCNALSATPTLWRKMLMSGGLERLSLRQITMGGEIADASTLRAISATFSQARLTHVYASTEAGVGFAVHDKQAGFPVSWLETGVRGIQLRIANDGCLWVSPGSVEQRYLGATEQLLATEGWINTGDVVRLEGERVHFCGRLNGSINIGGNKVFPEEVESIILEISGVGAVVVRARSSSVMGSLVEALVMLDSTAPRIASELIVRIRSHCREKLESYKVPAFIKIVDDFKTSSAGKIVRGG